MPPDWNTSQNRRRLSARKLCLQPYRPAYGGRLNSNTGPTGYRPVPGLTQLEETAIYIMLASGPMKIMAVYFSPSRPLMGTDLSASLSGGFPVLMAGDLNAKHVDWNLKLITTRGRRLSDCVNENSCLIYGPDTPTTIPYNSSATPDVLDSNNQRPSHPSVSDNVLCTKFRSLTCTDRHEMSIILS